MTALIMSSLLSLGFCGAPAYAAVTAESSSGTVTGNEDTGTVNGNTLNIVSGTTVGSAVAGSTITTVESGMTDSISADSVSGNTIAVTGGTVNSLAAGGLSLNGSTSENNAEISSGSTSYLLGGLSGTGASDQNTVTISGGTVSKMAASGASLYGGASNNTITVSDGSVEAVYGGIGNESLTNNPYRTLKNYLRNAEDSSSAAGETNSNHVIIEGGTVGKVYGASNWSSESSEEYSGNAVGNIVDFSGGTATGAITGGDTLAGDANKNIVNISGGTIKGVGIYAGSGVYGNAADNVINITGGTFTGDPARTWFGIEAGASEIFGKSVTGNIINIYDGTIGSSSIGTVEIDAGNNLGDTDAVSITSQNVVNIYGGTIESSVGKMMLIDGGYNEETGTDSLMEENAINISGGSIGAAGGNTNKIYGAVGIYGAGTMVNNTFSMTGGTIGASADAESGDTNEAAGAYTIEGDAKGNTAELTGGSFGAYNADTNTIMGAKSDDGNVSENTVILSGVTVGSAKAGNASLIGGDAEDGDASGNTVRLTNAAVDSASDKTVTIRGGYASGNATGNTVDINGGTYGKDSKTVEITGGYTGSGSASENTVNVQDSTVKGSITGGQTSTGDAASNKVDLNGANISGYIYGGHVTTSGNASTNAVTLTGGSTGSRYIYGGYTKKGASSHNTVSITGTDFTNSYRIYGGYAAGPGTTEDSSGSTYNTVSITDGDTAGSVTLNGGTSTEIYGGYAYQADAKNNEVTFDAENAIIRSIYGGEAARSGMAYGNTVNVKSGTLRALLFAGHAPSGIAYNNTLNISGGNIQVNSKAGAGYGQSASNNVFSISGGTFGRTNNNASITLAAGEATADGGSADHNTLIITGGTFGRQDYENANYINIYGGISSASEEDNNASFAANNMVSISGGVMNSYGDYVLIAGGYMEDVAASGEIRGSDTGDIVSSEASNNTVEIGGGSINDGTYENAGGDVNIIGADVTAGNVKLNTVTISDGTIGTADTGVTQIIGGYTGSGSASENKVTISGGTLGNPDTPMDEESDFLAGGFTEDGAASDNALTVSGGSILGNFALYGGYGTAGSTGNSITLSGSMSTPEVIAGYTGSGTASKNTINLESGTISASGIMAAGYSADGEASDNTVNITGGVLSGTAALYGGYGTTSTGNTLNVYSKGNTVGELGYFQKIYVAPEADLTINAADAEGAENTGGLSVENGTTVDAEGALTIAGDLSSDASTVTAENATIGGTVSSTNGSTVSLGGSNLALTTANVDNTSTLTLTSGKLTTEKLSDSITGGGKLTLDGTATLATTAGQVFTDGDTTETTAGDNGLTETAADSVNFKAGTLSLSDDYSYTYLTNIQKTMDALEDSTTSIVMTGNLVNTSGITDNTVSLAEASAIGDNVALNNVNVEASTNIAIGGASSDTGATSIAQGFSVGALKLTGDASEVSVTGGQTLTLGGSDTTDVITTESTATPTVTLTEGSTLNIGNSVVTEDKALNVAADVTAENSTIAANGQTTVTGDVTLIDSTLQAATGALTLEKDLTTSGTSSITGDVTVAASIKGDSTTTLNLGDETAAANLSAESINLSGGTLYLDPVWIGGTQQEGTEVAVGSLSNSNVIVGNNSTLTIGSTDKTLAEQAFTDSGLTWSDTDILSALYVATSTSLSNGSIIINSSATADSTATAGTFKMGKNSLLMVDGNKVSGSQAAAITDVSTTDISSSAKIYISNAKGNTTYNILSGTNVKDGNGLYAEAGAAVNSNVFSYGRLLEFVGAEGNGETQFSVTAESQDAHDVYGDKVIAPNTINAAMNSGGAASAFALAASDDNLTEEAQENAFNSASALTELAGVQHGLYAANNLFDSSLASHLTGLYTEDQDKDLWAHYIHSKENVRGPGLANMGASYDAQFNGVVVGSDFYKKGNATVGAALTYMDGSFSGNTEAAHTKNDIDYYGLALYGRVEQGTMTYLGDISYLHGSNDLKQHNSGSTITGSTDSDTYSIGVRAERGIGLGMGTLTPFAGLRYAHLGTDAYTDSLGVRHDSDDGNVWMLPLGLRYSADIKNGSWTIRPMAEAGYVWTFGDRDGTDKVSLDGASDAFGFDIADAGSWYGRLGIEAAKGNFTYGVAYQYQHGTSVQSNTWTAAVRYHF